MRALGAVFFALWAAQAQAEPVDDLLVALGASELTDVIREELLDYGETVGEAMLPEGGGAAWQAILARLYDRDLMVARVRSAMAARFEETDVAAALAFFESAQGKRLVVAELEARRALLVEGAEDAAAQACLEPEERADALLEFARVNDLLERNVAGTLNSDLAFYRGLVEGGVFEMAESEVLAEVQARVPEIRVALEAWLSGYLCAAYGDVARDDLAAYTAFSESDAGAALNAALFDGYGALYKDLSYALGLAVSVQILGEDL
mgnify:FL=1